MQNSILLVFMLVVLLFFLKSMQYVGNEPITLYTHLPQRPVYASVLDLSSTSVYRGYAILIIMLCHVTGSWNFVGFTPLGGIGVAMFLFLSGYGLNESWKKKVLRVIFPYVLFRMIWLMIDGSILAVSYTHLRAHET